MDCRSDVTWGAHLAGVIDRVLFAPENEGIPGTQLSEKLVRVLVSECGPRIGQQETPGDVWPITQGHVIQLKYIRGELCCADHEAISILHQIIASQGIGLPLGVMGE